MPRRIFNHADDDAAFREQGFVMLDLLKPTDIQSLSCFYEDVDGLHDSEFSATVLTDCFDMRQRVHQKVSSVFRERLLPVLNNYRIVVGSFAVKRANSNFSKVGLHQDLTFVKNEGEEVGLSLWCPLSEVNAENGYLGVVPGSHRFNSNYREPCSLPYPELINLIEEKFVTYIPMRPGQVLFLDNRMFHCSPRNTTEHNRVVAAGIAVPRESQLIYCHRDLEVDTDILEIYEVTDDFWLSNLVGERPHEGCCIGKVPRIVSKLTVADLATETSNAVPI
ncbi:prenyltransferase family protein [Leptolyngbya sp. Heron Island J]|uniref:phytanoyl-CoA dioxygenase family protein n=1 Tax=Leptolyngbya sp. Heron Island J TaxID=1385935 RepID=UPI0003B9DF79|nr:phytanoyl-CoA dioxygenase family protein [Leptolyngbya sp. Heron Island J]ESA38707.1 prenyltransferase family protein [Leptolyngbya sp. Heron Island J]